jgi:hypothetical protein
LIDVSSIAQLVAMITEVTQLVGLNIKDLAMFADLGSVMQVVGDLVQLASQLDGIAGRMNTRLGWWGAVQIPQTAMALQAFRQASTGQCYLASADAYGVQMLIVQLVGLLRTLMTLVSHVASITGTVAGLQAVQGTLLHLNGTVGVLTGIQSAANESTICQTLKTEVEKQAMEWIGHAALSDWGSYSNPFGR